MYMVLGPCAAFGRFLLRLPSFKNKSRHIQQANIMFFALT